jgi:hypothetical protein
MTPARAAAVMAGEANGMSVAALYATSFVLRWEGDILGTGGIIKGREVSTGGNCAAKGEWSKVSNQHYPKSSTRKNTMVTGATAAAASTAALASLCVRDDVCGARRRIVRMKVRLFLGPARFFN